MEGDNDFVELPADVERDAEKHAAFLERQVQAFQARAAAKKLRRKAAAASQPEAEDEQVNEEAAVEPVSAKSKKKKRKRNKKRAEAQEEEIEEMEEVPEEAPEEPVAVQEVVNPKKQKREEEDDELQRKLSGARFRLLNEQLYSIQSGEAVNLFAEHPDLFEVYHRGFAEQVNKWPENPLDHYIARVRELAAKNKHLAVADFGCGDGRLGKELARVVHKMHSFDLVAKFPHITACDMAHVPLPDSSVHVAIFCLALMGTNWEDFVREANRVLKASLLLSMVDFAEPCC